MRPRRFRWDCPTCGSHGYELTPRDAEREGIAHYVAAHGQAPDAEPTA